MLEATLGKFRTRTSGEHRVQATSTTAAGATIETIDGLDCIAHGWDAVAGACTTPVQQFIWTQAIAAAFPEYRLRFIVARARDDVVAVAPLAVRRQGWLERLELVGVRELHEPMDVVCGDPAYAEAIARAVSRLGLPIWLERVPHDSAFIPAMARAINRRGIMVTRPEHGYPWIALDASWSSALGRFNAGRRSDLCRMQRRAAQLGRVEYDVRCPSGNELQPLLDEAFRVEAASWKGRSGTALATDDRARRFFSRYAAAAYARGLLRLCFLRIDGRAAAMQIAVECSRRFWLLKIGYDEAYSRCSPGSLLMLHTLEDATRRGLVSYEFLGTAEPWTAAWTDAIRPCVSVRIYPANARGALALATDAVDSVLTKATDRTGRS